VNPIRSATPEIVSFAIFRTATFYQDSNGSYVRTIAPNPPDGGGTAQLEGTDAVSLFRVTVTIPFSYYHRA
jgi:hypothetical protein